MIGLGHDGMEKDGDGDSVGLGHNGIECNGWIPVYRLCSLYSDCLFIFQYCINTDEVAQLYSLSLDSRLDEQTLRQVAPAILYLSNQRSSCNVVIDENNSHSQRSSPSAGIDHHFACFLLLSACCNFVHLTFYSMENREKLVS